MHHTELLEVYNYTQGYRRFSITQLRKHKMQPSTDHTSPPSSSAHKPKIIPPEVFRYLGRDTHLTSLLQLHRRISEGSEPPQPGHLRLLGFERSLSKLDRNSRRVRLLESNTKDIFPQLVAEDRRVNYAVISHSSMGFKDPQSSVLKNMGPLIDAACWACQKKGIDYIWIDRICIMENNDVDRDWHLVNMANIYRCAGLCIVSPGNLMEGPEFLEINTPSHPPHIHNAWTLFEAACAIGLSTAEVSRKLVVIHRWPLGKGSWQLRGNVGAKVKITIREEVRIITPPDLTYTLALSPLRFILEGALDSQALRFYPGVHNGQGGIGEEGTGLGGWHPQLLGTSTSGPAAVRVGSPQYRLATSGSSQVYPYHDCSACIRLFLELLSPEVFNAEEGRGPGSSKISQRYREGILLSAYTRYYPCQGDIVHILRPLLTPNTRFNQPKPPPQTNPPKWGKDAWLMANLQDLLASQGYSSNRPEWLWLVSLSSAYSTHTGLPCLPSIKSPAAWSERELEAASDPGPELWPLVDIWLGKAGHGPLFEPDEKFSIKRARMRREPTGPAVVALTARAVQKTLGDSEPATETQHVSKWPWKLRARTSRARRSKPTEVWYLYAGERRIQEEAMNEHRDLDGSSEEPYYALILVVTQHVDSTDAKRRYYAHTGWRMMSVQDANQKFAAAKEKNFELVVESY